MKRFAQAMDAAGIQAAYIDQPVAVRSFGCLGIRVAVKARSFGQSLGIAFGSTIAAAVKNFCARQ